MKRKISYESEEEDDEDEDEEDEETSKKARVVPDDSERLGACIVPGYGGLSSETLRSKTPMSSLACGVLCALGKGAEVD